MTKDLCLYFNNHLRFYLASQQSRCCVLVEFNYIYVCTNLITFVASRLFIWNAHSIHELILPSAAAKLILRFLTDNLLWTHYSDVIMSAVVSQITSFLVVCSVVCSGADQRKHESSVWLAFVKGIHRWLVNSPLKGPVTRKMFPFDDVMT